MTIAPSHEAASESVAEFLERFKIGTENIRLARDDGGLHKIERVIRCEGGVEHYYREELQDWLEVPGHWVVVETLARGLKDTDEAREFMLAREAAPKLTCRLTGARCPFCGARKARITTERDRRGIHSATWWCEGCEESGPCLADGTLYPAEPES